MTTATYSNDLLFVGDRFTGQFSGMDCYGANKAEIIQKIASDYQIDLEKSYAYSDHRSDIPMLKVVGNPVAVNPDSELQSHAKENGWDIEWWHE